MFEWFSASVLYSIVKDLWARFRPRRRILTAKEKLELRARWKPLFEEYLLRQHREKLRTDVVIRDMKRVDAYPDLNENEKGISPWFKLGLVGTYHRGIMVAHQWVGLVKDGESWRLQNYKAGEESDFTALLISRIPYDNIEHVDWSGDEYYSFPHIYCFFDNKKEPYEGTGYYRQFEVRDDLPPHYSELVTYEEARRRSKKHGIK